MPVSARDLKQTMVKGDQVAVRVIANLQSPETGWPHILAMYTQLGLEAESTLNSLTFMLQIMEKFDPNVGKMIMYSGALIGASHLSRAVDSGVLEEDTVKMYESLVKQFTGPGKSSRVDENVEQNVLGSAQMFENIRAGGFFDNFNFKKLIVVGLAMFGILAMFFYFYSLWQDEESSSKFWNLWGSGASDKTFLGYDSDKQSTFNRVSNMISENIAQPIMDQMQKLAMERKPDDGWFFSNPNNLKHQETFYPSDFDPLPDDPAAETAFGSLVNNFVENAGNVLGGAKSATVDFRWKESTKEWEIDQVTRNWERIGNGYVPPANVQQALLQDFLEKNPDLSKLDSESENYKILSALFSYNLGKLGLQATVGLVYGAFQKWFYPTKIDAVAENRPKLLAVPEALAAAGWLAFFVKGIYTTFFEMNGYQVAIDFFWSNQALVANVTGQAAAAAAAKTFLPNKVDWTAIGGLTSLVGVTGAAVSGAASIPVLAAAAAPFLFTAAGATLAGYSAQESKRAEILQRKDEQKLQMAKDIAPYVWEKLQNVNFRFPDFRLGYQELMGKNDLASLKRRSPKRQALFGRR